MAFLLRLDVTLFRLLNRSVANPLFDVLMPLITEEDHWRIPLLLLVFTLLVFGHRKERISVLLALFAVTLSDPITSSILKPWVARIRPCFVLPDVRLLIDQPPSPSFPSAHAANLAAAATLFSVHYPSIKALPIGLALLIGYSRVYVGVHYPSDVVAGWLLGILCATFILFVKDRIMRLVSRWRNPYQKKKSVGP